MEGTGYARERLESIGGSFNGRYSFNDIIFIPRDGDFNLNDSFVRVRVYSENNWPTKDVVLVNKQTEFKETGKTDKVLVREEFDTEKGAFSYLEKNFGGYKRGFNYERVGWEYELDGHRIFVEDIEGFEPSIEAEAETVGALQKVFERIGIIKEVKDSVPEIMRKLKHI